MMHCRQLTLRTLFLVVTAVGLALGIFVEEFRAQNAAIKQLGDRGIFIYAEPMGPAWLTNLTDTEHFFVRPVQAQVLVGIGPEGLVQIGGKELTLSDARQELLEIRKVLSREVNLTGFAMVMDVRNEGDPREPNRAELWGDLAMLAFEVDSFLSPCGISNFRQ